MTDIQAESSTGTVTLRGVPDVMSIVGPLRNGPIVITKAVLTQSGVSEDIYFVALSGVKSIIFNPNNIPSCLLAGISMPNPYLHRVKRLCRERIPKGAKIVFGAHSLGGMTAQLFAADKSMKSRYEILCITALGSPLVWAAGREGELHRLADTSDPLFRLSVTGGRNRRSFVSFESGGYKERDPEAHTQSYLRQDVWGDYDCLGIKGGDAEITYNEEDVFVYPYSEHSMIFF